METLQIFIFNKGFKHIFHVSIILNRGDKGSLYSQIFLLSEHILRKESIVIVKKFDFEIFIHLYVLRSPEFILVIFTVMYACIRMWVYVSEHDSV